MGKRNQPENKEAAPESQQVVTENTEKRPVTYVVVRDGYRVSDREYHTADDPVALTEKKFWTTVANKHSHGEKCGIVPYDSRKHRVW